MREGGREYRAWNPRRSKLAAFLHKGFRGLQGLRQDATVLYLGAATGTTVSHLSDMLPSGTIHAVEFSPTAFRKLLGLGRARRNVVPVLADAAHPDAYTGTVGRVEFLYQDVAQRDQAGIFLRNLPLLTPGGLGILMVKARSVDVALEPSEVYAKAAAELKAHGCRVDPAVDLAPWERDHGALVVRPPGGP